MIKFHIKLICDEDYNEEEFNANLKECFTSRASMHTTTQKSPEEFEDMLNDARNEGNIVKNIFAYDAVLYKLLQVKHYDLLLDQKVRLYVNFKEVDVDEMLEAASKRYAELFCEGQGPNLDLSLEAIERHRKHILTIDPLVVYQIIGQAVSDYKLDKIEETDFKGKKSW